MDLNSKSLEPFIDKLAKENGLTREEVRKIIRNQFMFVKQKMREVDSYNKHWPYVYCPYLATFKVKDKKKKYFEDKSKKNIEDVHSESK